MLTEYKHKRDFKKTPEPAGAKAHRSSSALSFVVQKHAARTLHYDFRLELDAVLKSWAVPKGPSLDPSRKALAVEVEDHPLEYGKFEGSIPKGQYGGGTVEIWDHGTWEPVDEPHEGLKQGKLRFILHGKKLNGQWTLVRFRNESNGRKHNWLLIKSRDSAPHNGSPTKTATSFPTNIRPQLATWIDHPPEGDQWLHEVKFDGYRLIARIDNGKVQLITRGNQDWTHRFPGIAREFERIPGPAILDGEVVVMDAGGKSQFQLLQNTRKNHQNVDPVIFLFDLLFIDGQDLRSQPLLQRKNRLKKLLDDQNSARLKFSDHVLGNGQAVVDSACKMALEGIISKQIDSPYVGGRTRTWLKSKCGFRQEFVIIGYTDPKGAREEFGSLLLGYYDKQKKLVYAGRVGTGFDAALLSQLKRQLTRHARPTPPTDVPPPPRGCRMAHWIAPGLVAEVKFAGWTQDNLLRQAAFLGLREDKKPRQVVREDQSSARLVEKRVKSLAGSLEETSETKLTHPDRIVFPGTAITKQKLAEYYQLVASRMLHHVVDRPLTLLRCPAGAGAKCFIQRRFSDNLPSAIHSIDAGEPEAHMLIRDAIGLRALVQINALEIHVWGCAPSDIEHPDRLVFDLDPDATLPWATIVKAAREMRELLHSVKLPSFVKTTGGKGLHIVVPIEPTVSWDQAKSFCRSLAQELASRDPKRYTINSRKTERPGRIFIDYLRNDRSATSVAPYSARAREGAPISFPVDWTELAALKGANRITVNNVNRRLKRDPWADFDSSRVDLRKVVNAK